MWNSDIVINLKSRPVTTTTAKTTTTTTTTTVTTTTIPVKPVINYGDVNGDKKVDSRDASAVLIEYAKSSTVAGGSFTETQKLAADINGDKKVDSRDASAILLYYALSSTNKYSRIEDFMADYFKK
ncbi:MAG: dockerin type I domain-containing protein [Ruminococcus sp.]|nr:dockerin type I domain-containing protein [Ruminococcus sp.]